MTGKFREYLFDNLFISKKMYYNASFLATILMMKTIFLKKCSFNII